MKYCSTRGHVKGLSFTETIMMGLADDGGLLLPEQIPSFCQKDMESMSNLPYADLAFQIISRFATDIPSQDLKDIIDRSYQSFNHKDITPLIKRNGLFILELFHGPTLAFKDVALQFLGNLFEYVLAKNNQRMNIIGATSGDTGSAAIYGVRGKDNINIFILHPKGKVSSVQELQMTTVLDENVFNLAIEGTFDDGQSIVKEIFGDLKFKEEHALGAVNSINWARVLAQVVYYFYAWFRVQEQTGAERVEFSVPTGNFGDIFAGYIAKQMGVPVNRLILATNANNILSRFVTNGDYSTAEVQHSLSPSMDIQVASNFERYLYYLYNCDAVKVQQAMDSFRRSGCLHFSVEEMDQVAADFASAYITDEQTIATISQFYAETQYVLDPHTAVGIAVGKKIGTPGIPLVCLATAHPAKFGETVEAAIQLTPELPAAFADLKMRERRVAILKAETEIIKKYVAENSI